MPHQSAESTSHTESGPLAGLVVLDLSRALAGPHAAMMLGDLGARIIKIEAPGGDESRGWGPPFVGPEHDPQSTYFLSCNRNKESIVLDLKTEGGREALSRLVARADVLIENFRPGVLDRLGFPTTRLHALNRRLVILSISGFGHDGPERDRPGYDQIVQGEAGLMSLTGDTPTRIGVPISDVLAGMYGAYGVLAALHLRGLTGTGTVVRTSLLAAVVGAHAFQGTRYTVAGEVSRGTGNHHPTLCPYGLFRCADGEVQIAVGNDRMWQRFAHAFGLPVDTPGFATNAERLRNQAAVREAIVSALSTYTREKALAVLADLGIPAGAVRNLHEVYSSPQTRSQGLLLQVDHPSLGIIELPGPPLRFEDGQRSAHQAPPTLGQHTQSVLAWLDASANCADHPPTDSASRIASVG
ncbi:CaiB/BaiF CoA transferase family protein [Micromonospora sp. NPDC005161]